MGIYDTVMVGVDGSDSSYRAVHRATELAKDARARLVIVCAYQSEPHGVAQHARDVLGEEAYQVRGPNPAEETLRVAAERAYGQGMPEQAIETTRLRGDPVPSLVTASRRADADVLVVGDRGLNTLTGRILGSVPGDVTRRAPCDVVIAHTTS